MERINQRGFVVRDEIRRLQDELNYYERYLERADILNTEISANIVILTGDKFGWAT